MPALIAWLVVLPKDIISVDSVGFFQYYFLSIRNENKQVQKTGYNQTLATQTKQIECLGTRQNKCKTSGN